MKNFAYKIKKLTIYSKGTATLDFHNKDNLFEKRCGSHRAKNKELNSA